MGANDYNPPSGKKKKPLTPEQLARRAARQAAERAAAEQAGADRDQAIVMRANQLEERGWSRSRAAAKAMKEYNAANPARRGPSTATVYPGATAGAGRGRPIGEIARNSRGGGVDPYNPTGFRSSNASPGGNTFVLRTEAERQARIDESPLTIRPRLISSTRDTGVAINSRDGDFNAEESRMYADRARRMGFGSSKPAPGSVQAPAAAKPQFDRSGSGARIASGQGQKPMTVGTMLPKAQQIRMDGAGEVGPPKALANPAPKAAPTPAPATPAAPTISPDLTQRDRSGSGARIASGPAKPLASVASNGSPTSTPSATKPASPSISLSSPAPMVGANTSRAMGLPANAIDRTLGMANQGINAVGAGVRAANQAAMTAATLPGRAAGGLVTKSLQGARGLGKRMATVGGAIKKDLSY